MQFFPSVPTFHDARRLEFTTALDGVVDALIPPSKTSFQHPALAQYLKEWRAQSPFSKVDDFLFPSLLKDGKVPMWASTFVQDHLRPAAVAAGVVLTKGQRVDLHNLRHSLSTCLVNKGKVDPKTVQGMLRHSDIRTTMNLYTQDDRDEKQAAQGAFLSAVGLGSRIVQ